MQTTIRTTTIEKYAGDTFTVTFNFEELLEVGETITNASVTIVNTFGIDPNPSNVLSGQAQVDSGGGSRKILQKIRQGLAGRIYRLTAVATTSNANAWTLIGMLKVLEG